MSTIKFLLNGDECYAKFHENDTDFGPETGMTVYGPDDTEIGASSECASEKTVLEWWLDYGTDGKAFEWYELEGRLYYRVSSDGATFDFRPIDRLEVIAYDGFRPSLVFYTKGEVCETGWEVNPKEFSEADREVMRKLLRHLKYRKATSWEWKVPA